MTEVAPRRQRGPDPWIEAAYLLLAEHGHSAVTIERLTAATAKTRGSFYHHFGSMETFVVRLVADWQERNTERIVRLAHATREPGKRRRVLNREAGQLDARVETAFRIWAGLDQQVRATCDAVDDRRVSVLAQDLDEFAKALGCDLPDGEATALAQIEYAAFIGGMLLASKGKSSLLLNLGPKYDDMLTAYLRYRQP
jgi:AcrR family transcriptional regulator